MIKKGKLIVIEGVDGSGKETQSRELFKHLRECGMNVMSIAFPRYDRPSSAMIKQYLAGDFGTKPEDVNPYAASSFYAADRYAAFKEEMQPFLAAGGVVIADRYTTSNMIHQAVKLHDASERQTFLDWLVDYEFNLLGLPKPDLVFFLDVPPATGQDLMLNRKNKITGEMKKDIHEADAEYLRHAYDTAKSLAESQQWRIIQCTESGKMRRIKSIHQEIFEIVSQLLGNRQ